MDRSISSILDRFNTHACAIHLPLDVFSVVTFQGYLIHIINLDLNLASYQLNEVASSLRREYEGPKFHGFASENPHVVMLSK